jgi:hypothetical protein
MIIQPIPSDGNCLFGALASFFRSPQINHRILRRMLVHYIVQHPKDFEMDILAEGYPSVDAYCQHMARENTWGDGVCLQCFTMIFNVNVWVCYSRNGAANGANEANEAPTLISSHKEGAPNLALLLTNNHYDRILAWK